MSTTQRSPDRAIDQVALIMSSRAQGVQSGIRKLKSVHESGLGIVEVVACGKSAIPALRELLFQREPSGLFEARCRAVDALSSLRAYDVLVEYLSAEHRASDPVERLGDDAVINCAAWAVARTGEEHVFALLPRLAQRPSLNGVIGALGAFGRVEAIPALISALEEDVSRKVAEYILRRMGRSGCAALLVSAKERHPPAGRESESSLRRRRSSLALLAEVGLSPGAWPQIRCLMHDTDAKVVLLACKLWLIYAPHDERRDAAYRLAGLLPSADWRLRQEIESCLDTAEQCARSSPAAPKPQH